MNAYQLKNMTVTIGPKTILNIPLLSIEKGKRLAIVGPSGAGKSTLLRILNLLQTPTNGKMNFFGDYIQWKRMSARKKIEIQRQMAFVFQKPMMFDKTVYKNVELGLRFRRFSKREMDKRVTWALHLVGLEDYKNRHAHDLSGGEAQRIALARSIATQPRILLLDEATANLDPSNVQIIERVITRLHEKTNMTVIMVTHNLQQARRIADVCMFVNKGQVVEIANTEDFFNPQKDTPLYHFLSGDMVY